MKKHHKLIAEYINYSKNPLKFIENYFYGHDFSSEYKIGTLKMQDFEKQALQSFFDHKRVFITKSRQMFFSTMIVKYLLYQIVFGEEQSILVISNSSASAINLKKRLMIAIQKLPEYFQPNFIKDNEKLLETNDCFIQFTGPSSNAGKAQMINTVIFDEVAFIDKFQDIYSAVSLCVYPHGNIIMGTSLNNNNTEFCNFYNGVLEIKNNWTHIYLHWSENSFYNSDLTYNENLKPTSTWYRNQCEKLQNDIHKIHEELDCHYDASIIETLKKRKEEKQKDRVITFRIDDRLEKQLSALILKRTMSENKSFNISDYLRELIQKDMVSNGL